PGAALGWAAAAGAALGVTFLVHTAPAITGGLVIVAYALVEARSGEGVDRPALRVALALAVAFLVSLPFSFEILWHYHLKIVNPFPSNSPSDLLDLNELPGLARRLATLPSLVAVAALVVRARAGVDRGTRLLFVWLGVIAAALAAHMAAIVLAKAHVELPAIVPPFHFFFYLMTILAIAFGIGVRDAVVRVASARWRPVLVCAMALAAVAAGVRSYLTREDFTGVRQEATAMGARYAPDLIGWIRAHTSPHDVFLCADDASMYLVTPAGRKVVAINRYFSNPYVDWTTRDADRARMFHALERADVAGFAAIARSYDVRFVVLSLDRTTEWLRAAGLRPSDLPAIDEATLAGLPGFAPAL